jgi:hypothetical protein
MLLRGCWAVSVEPIVCVWNRSASADGSVAPKRSRMMRSQIRRAARNFATSSMSVEFAAKKNESCPANRSTTSPADSAASTYAIAFAKVNASSCTASAPASRM